MYIGFFDKHGCTYWWINKFSAHCKHVPCNTLTHSTNEYLLSIKRKGDPKSGTLSRTSDTTETRNPYVIKVIVLACFTYIDIFKFIKSLLTYWQEFFRTRVRLNETRFGPKKSRPRYMSAQKISTLFWCTGWAGNWQIIFRFASIHGPACFIFEMVNCLSTIISHYCFHIKSSFVLSYYNTTQNMYDTCFLSQ